MRCSICGRTIKKSSIECACVGQDGKPVVYVACNRDSCLFALITRIDNAMRAAGMANWFDALDDIDEQKEYTQ